MLPVSTIGETYKYTQQCKQRHFLVFKMANLAKCTAGLLHTSYRCPGQAVANENRLK